MIISIIFLITAALAYWFYTTRFVPAEVRRNAADILANGAADDLRAGYHQRRSWARLWPSLGCVLLGSGPMALAGWLPFALAFLSMATLLGGYFAARFTPLLNLTRGLDEYHASSDSASWPDAAIWRKLRADHIAVGLVRGDSSLQLFADNDLQRLLTHLWLLCRLAALLLTVAAVVAATNS